MGELFVHLPEEQVPSGEKELGETLLSELSLPELEKLHTDTIEESVLAHDINQTRTSEEHRRDVQLRLRRIEEAMKAKEGQE
jgi:hypothetical protein